MPDSNLEKWRKLLNQQSDDAADYYDEWRESVGMESERQRTQRRLHLTSEQYNGLIIGTHKVVRKRLSPNPRNPHQ